MKNTKKMMLALTMLSLGSTYISAMGLDTQKNKPFGPISPGPVTGPVTGPVMSKPVTEVTYFLPANSKDLNDKSGKWYENLKTASVGVGTRNQTDYTDVYEMSGTTGSQNNRVNTDFTPRPGYEQIGISSIGSGSSAAGYRISYLFGKPAIINDQPVNYQPIQSGVDGQTPKSGVGATTEIK